MTDVAVDTLRLRGPHARRLTAVAVGALPAALERALADVGDVDLERVSVRLDLDVDEYDDATLAVLWADAIRAGVLAAGAGARRVTARPRWRAAPSWRRTWGTAEVLAAARAWRAGDAPGLPAALLALGEPATARAVAAAAGPDEWSALMTVLARVLGLVPPAPADTPRRTADAAEAGEGPAHDAGTPTAPVPPVPDAPSPGPEAEGTGARPPSLGAGPGPRVQQALSELAGLVWSDHVEVGPSTLTRAAGLVLLHPWLADHCRRAEDLHPGLDPLEVREAALAALVDDDLGALDDPLVALLAGRRDPESGRTRLPLPARDEVAESAVGVLRSFVALLPGFEGSTPAFVRDCWIVRLGLVDHDRDPVLLTATTHPLDVLLPSLPYPVGLVKLPWSPPVAVRFRP